MYADTLLTKAASAVFPLRPGAIIDALDLRRPGFARLSTYGHFGDSGAWENEYKYKRQLENEVNRLANAAKDHTDW